MIRVDCTQNGCVVVCDECPHWFAFRFDRDESWKAARDHEQRVHPGAHQAATVLDMRRRRRRVA